MQFRRDTRLERWTNIQLERPVSCLCEDAEVVRHSVVQTAHARWSNSRTIPVASVTTSGLTWISTFSSFLWLSNSWSFTYSQPTFPMEDCPRGVVKADILLKVDLPLAGDQHVAQRDEGDVAALHWEDADFPCLPP